MSNELTCCQVITRTQVKLGQLTLNPPDTPEGAEEAYLWVANRGLELASESLSLIEKRSCDLFCCLSGSKAIVKITKIYLLILDEIACLFDELDLLKEEYCKFLKLLEKTLAEIVDSSKSEGKCCVETQRAITIFRYHQCTVLNRLLNTIPQAERDPKVCQIIQRGYDQLAKAKPCLDCCVETGQALRELQSSGLNVVDEPVTITPVKDFDSTLDQGFAVAIKGNRAYVTDNGTNDVRIFDISTGGELIDFGGFDLVSPQGIAICDNLVYVSDRSDFNTIKVFDLAQNELNPPLVQTFGEGFLSGVRGIDVSGGTVYAANEFGYENVSTFDTITGAYLGSFGQGVLDQAYDVSVSKGKIYVLDFSNDESKPNLKPRIEVFDVQTQKSLFSFGQGQLTFPQFLQVAGSRVYVSNPAPDSIKIFDAETGEFVTQVLVNGQNSDPSGIAIQGNNLLLVDRGNNLVEEFALNPITDDEAQAELNFLKSVVDQTTDKCQLKSECCLSELMAEIYARYAKFDVDPIRQSPNIVELRKVTSEIYCLLAKLAEVKIKQDECCKQALRAIEKIYDGYVLRYIRVVTDNGSTEKLNDNVITQVKRIINSLLH